MDKTDRLVLFGLALVTAGFLAWQRIISGETWIALAMGLLMPSPLEGRGGPRSGALASSLGLLALVLFGGCDVQTHWRLFPVESERISASAKIGADGVEMSPLGANPITSGKAGVYAKSTDNLVRFVDTSGVERKAGESWMLRQSAGTPAGATAGDVWYETGSGAFAYKDGSGVQTFPAAGNLVTLTGTQELTNKTLTAGVIKTGLTASGSASNDFSGSTGTFKTSTGAVTIGPGAVSISGALTTVSGTMVYAHVVGGVKSAIGMVTGYLTAPGQAVSTSTEPPLAVVTRAGTVKSMRCFLGTAPGGADTAAFTVRKNGSDGAVTCTITGSATTCSDTSNSFTVAAGDRLSIKVVSSAGTAADATCAFEEVNS